MPIQDFTGPIDFATPMLRAQQLVPDYVGQDLERKAGEFKTQAMRLANQQTEQQMVFAANDQARGQQRQQALAAAMDKYHAAPTVAGAANLISTFPELREPVLADWNMRGTAAQKSQLSAMSQVQFALKNKRPDLAKNVIQRHIDAAKSAGEDASDDEQMLQMLDDDPGRAEAHIHGLLAAIVGPEKLGDTTNALGEDARAEQLLPATMQKAAAEASKATTDAEYAAPVYQSNLANDEANRRNITSMISTRAAQVDLARDTLESNVQIKLDELAQTGIQPDPGSVAIMNNAVVSGSSNAALAEQTRRLADEFAASPARGGMFSGLAETGKSVFGAQDSVSLLRSRYEQLKNSTAIKSLPPGPASDHDIKLAMKGFPSPGAPREYLVSWLRGMAKLQDIQSQNDNSRAEWIAGNGNLGNAKRDLYVNGVQIPRGTSFVDYQKRSTAAAGRRTMPPRSYMEFAK
ncbi:hypothetical protein [Sphingomonas endolithica]|uniref:hypothetical protein n=1 Tax=Sphingomonas endolithica TaxID=2972485 RepID=UPI0021AFF766|nr:hypothetical protein [Sphingomonas sp. ZFBP2030]